MQVLQQETGDSKCAFSSTSGIGAAFEPGLTHSDRPSVLLTRLVDAGHLGKKSGIGFYKYDSS